MKSINSKKARKEIGDLVTDLATYSRWLGDLDDKNYRYFRKCQAECIVELKEAYGIPSIHYESDKELLSDPFWAEATYTKA
jgi:hypothetical protein